MAPVALKKHTNCAPGPFLLLHIFGKFQRATTDNTTARMNNILLKILKTF
jgi:hypothetical protein